jgi:hypothetical protein
MTAVVTVVRFWRLGLVDGQGRKANRLAAPLALSEGPTVLGQARAAATVLLLLEWLASGRRYGGSHVDHRYQGHQDAFPGNAGPGNSAQAAFSGGKYRSDSVDTFARALRAVLKVGCVFVCVVLHVTAVGSERREWCGIEDGLLNNFVGERMYDSRADSVE